MVNMPLVTCRPTYKLVYLSEIYQKKTAGTRGSIHDNRTKLFHSQNLIKRNLPEKTAGTRSSIHDNRTKLFHSQNVEFQQNFKL